MPEVDIDLADIGHHIAGLEAVLLQIFHLPEKALFWMT